MNLNLELIIKQIKPSNDSMMQIQEEGVRFWTLKVMALRIESY